MCHPHSLGQNTWLTTNTASIVDYNEKVKSILRKARMEDVLVPLSEAIIHGSLV